MDYKNTNYATKKSVEFLLRQRSDKKSCSECRKYNAHKLRCLLTNKNKSPYRVACRSFYEN